MKVCTDACLFAAWTCSIIKEKNIVANTILDIGAGTGLISLMLAQEIAGKIDTIEIDKEAFEQCTENIRDSPFQAKIKAYHSPIQQFISPIGDGYDFIISNPPFFEQDLKSKDAARNRALHDDSLNLNELMIEMNRLISPIGKCAVLLPYHRLVKWMEICKTNGWHIQETCRVKQTPKHPFFRTFLMMSKQPTIQLTSEITIKEDDIYSNKFQKLLRPFYLAIND
jgi:tRNA1Val (adenine37-N6)-methyltransferase